MSCPNCITVAFSLVLTFSQLDLGQVAPKPVATPTPEPAKANARPTPTPAAAEPFDKADVKTMASKCVKFETEAGEIVAEMYPESVPETVRNF